MHRRDFAALLLSVLALHLALRRDAGFLGIFTSSSSSPSSPLSLRKAWYHATPPDVSASLDGVRYVPPQPLVVRIRECKRKKRDKKREKGLDNCSRPSISTRSLNLDLAHHQKNTNRSTSTATDAPRSSSPRRGEKSSSSPQPHLAKRGRASRERPCWPRPPCGASRAPTSRRPERGPPPLPRALSSPPPQTSLWPARLASPSSSS